MQYFHDFGRADLFYLLISGDLIGGGSVLLIPCFGSGAKRSPGRAARYESVKALDFFYYYVLLVSTVEEKTGETPLPSAHCAQAKTKIPSHARRESLRGLATNRN